LCRPLDVPLCSVCGMILERFKCCNHWCLSPKSVPPSPREASGVWPLSCPTVGRFWDGLTVALIGVYRENRPIPCARAFHRGTHASRDDRLLLTLSFQRPARPNFFSRVDSLLVFRRSYNTGFPDLLQISRNVVLFWKWHGFPKESALSVRTHFELDIGIPAHSQTKVSGQIRPGR
jgi:hypothetical protein